MSLTTSNKDAFFPLLILVLVIIKQLHCRNFCFALLKKCVILGKKHYQQKNLFSILFAF